MGVTTEDVVRKKYEALSPLMDERMRRCWAGMIAVALLVSIVMGTLLTRSVLALTSTVKRFADKDFSARTAVLPRDEIGQLAASFNTMAATIQEHSEHLEVLVEQRTKELVAEKQTSERLLLNVLPAPIADALVDHAERMEGEAHAARSAAAALCCRTLSRWRDASVAHSATRIHDRAPVVVSASRHAERERR